MMIQYNLMALNANNMLGINTKNKSRSMERLSSGYRISKAADDAAGLSISEKMRSQVRGLTRAAENAEDGISLCQTADGALSEVTNMLHRMTELSIQAANIGVNELEDRRAIQEEINELIEEIDRISDTAEFNKKKIFSRDKSEINGTATTDSGDITLNVNDSSKIDTDAVYTWKTDQVTTYVESTLDVYHYGSNDDAIFNGHFNRISVEITDAGKNFSISPEYDELGDKLYAFYLYKHESTPYSIPEDGWYIRMVKDFINVSDYINVTSGTPKMGEEYKKYKWLYDEDLKYGGFDSVAPLDAYAKVRGSESTNCVEFVHGGSKTEEKTGWFKEGGNALDEDYFIPDSSAFNDIWGTSYTGNPQEGATINLKTDDSRDWWLQVGANAGQGINLDFGYMNSKIIGVKGLNITTGEGAQRAITASQDAMNYVTSMRSKIGAYQNRIEFAVKIDKNSAENLQDAESRIRDTDMGEEMSVFSKNNILEQAAQTVLAQANQANQGVLSLIQ